MSQPFSGPWCEFFGIPTDAEYRARAEKKLKEVGMTEKQIETKGIVDPLWEKIQQKKQELLLLENKLKEEQDLCDHIGTEEYRERTTGKCSICKYEFLTKLQIDAIYSE